MFPISKRRNKVCTQTIITRGRTTCTAEEPDQEERDKVHRIEASTHMASSLSCILGSNIFPSLQSGLGQGRGKKRLLLSLRELDKWAGLPQPSLFFPGSLEHGSGANGWRKKQVTEEGRVVEQRQLSSKTLWTPGPWERQSHKVLLDAACVGLLKGARSTTAGVKPKEMSPQRWCQHASCGPLTLWVTHPHPVALQSH